MAAEGRKKGMDEVAVEVSLTFHFFPLSDWVKPIDTFGFYRLPKSGRISRLSFKLTLVYIED